MENRKSNVVFLGEFIPEAKPIEPVNSNKISYFKGTENGIEDIECPPDEGELPDQDYNEKPTPYDP